MDDADDMFLAFGKGEVKEFDAAISICQQAAELGIPYSSLPGGMAERKEKLIERKTAYENKEI